MLLLIDPGLKSSPTLLFFGVNEDKTCTLSNLKSAPANKELVLIKESHSYIELLNEMKLLRKNNLSKGSFMACFWL